MISMEERKPNVSRSRANAGWPPPSSTERGAVVNKTQEYLEIFSRFKNRESVEAVDRLLNSQPDLEPFEKAQLGSLCCDSAEEAKTLIPSLEHKKTDEELQDLLNEVSGLIDLGLGVMVLWCGGIVVWVNGRVLTILSWGGRLPSSGISSIHDRLLR